MREKNRQLIIFGNFHDIDSDKIRGELADLINEHNLQLGVAQDFGPIVRPALYSQDGNESIVFAMDRIYLQQSNAALNDYDAFLTKSTGIIKEIVSKLSLAVKRLACNGSIIGFEQGRAEEIYAKFFKPDSFLYDEHSIEWDFSINKQITEQSLDCTVNQIIKIIRGVNVIGLDGTAAGPLVVTYDYNTLATDDRDFMPADFDTFASLAKHFRSEVANLRRHNLRNTPYTSGKITAKPGLTPGQMS